MQGAMTNPGGRPALPPAARKVVVQVRMPPSLIEEIDEIAAARADGPDRSQIIRELLAKALAAEKGRR